MHHHLFAAIVNITDFTPSHEDLAEIIRAYEKDLKEKNSLVFPFDSERFMNTWNVLSAEPKWRKKTRTALQMCLKELSKHTEEDAVQMMENSIRGGYQGLFEIKNSKNGGGKSGTTKLQTLISVSADVQKSFDNVSED